MPIYGVDIEVTYDNILVHANSAKEAAEFVQEDTWEWIRDGDVHISPYETKVNEKAMDIYVLTENSYDTLNGKEYLEWLETRPEPFVPDPNQGVFL